MKASLFRGHAWSGIRGVAEMIDIGQHLSRQAATSCGWLCSLIARWVLDSLTSHLVAGFPSVSIPKDLRGGSKVSYNRGMGAPESCFHPILLVKNITGASLDTKVWESGSISQSKEHHKYTERRN